MSDEVTPFRIAVPEAALDDLRDRLARTSTTGSAARSSMS
jgi:hypothetical protein